MTLKQSLVVIEKPLGLGSWTWKAALRRNMRNNNQGLFRLKELPFNVNEFDLAIAQLDNG